jgi:hypothetical protein
LWSGFSLADAAAPAAGDKPSGATPVPAGDSPGASSTAPDPASPAAPSGGPEADAGTTVTEPSAPPAAASPAPNPDAPDASLSPSPSPTLTPPAPPLAASPVVKTESPPTAPAASLTLSALNPPALVDRAPRPPRYRAALPLGLEGRFGFSARTATSFPGASDEELVDTAYALGAFLGWNSEYAIGVELEHAGLGRVKAISGPNSVDAEYGATSGWLALRVFPWRGERFDVYFGLRVGLAFQHVDAFGTRGQEVSTLPAQVFHCSEWDGPGFGLGGGVGVDYRLSERVAVLGRLDATGERLSGSELGSCALGVGSVTSVSAGLGLAYEFDLDAHSARVQAARAGDASRP